MPDQPAHALKPASLDAIAGHSSASFLTIQADPGRRQRKGFITMSPSGVIVEQPHIEGLSRSVALTGTAHEAGAQGRLL
jgi:hypothetical protein